MSTSSIQSIEAFKDLAATITQRFDTDGDGRLSTGEFSGFLQQFLGTLGTGAASAAATGTANAVAGRDPVATMSGFSESKLADSSHQSFKYQIGRILQYYPNTATGLRAALPEIQQLVPGATIAGSKGDQLDFGDYLDPRDGRIGVVDVLKSAGLGGTAWQWMPVS